MSQDINLSMTAKEEYRTDIYFISRNCFQHPPHFHKQIEVVFVFDGIFETYCDSINYSLTGGSVFITGTNAIHYSANFAAISNSILLIIDPKKLTGPARQLATKTPISPVWKNPKKDSVVWSLIQYALDHKHRLNSDELNLVLSTIIALIIKDMELLDLANKTKTEHKILEYCRNHYTEDISVKTVAHALSISESHISHIFRKVLGCSFPQYINALRLEHAEILLKTTKKTCTQIAAQSGFSTLRTFNRVFLQFYNTTPLQYRKQLNANADSPPHQHL